MEEEEKPKRKKITSKEMFPGMKKPPKFGKPKQPKKKYGPFAINAKIKPGMSPYQKKTMVEFFKVREGETMEQWKKRTARRRVKEIDEIAELKLMHPLRINQRKKAKYSIKKQNSFIRVQPVDREFDFMRYYGIVVNYASIKYGIRKEDLEVGFYFYNNIPFTKDRFENAMILITGTKLKKLQRFIDDKLMEEIIQTKKQYDGPDKQVKTYLYRLTQPFLYRLTTIYRILGKMNGINISLQPVLSPLPPEAKQIIQDMNSEIQDIQTGRKPQDLI